MRCSEFGLGCNVFRIELGVCTFGLIIASTENDSHDVEVFMKGLILLSELEILYYNDILDGQLSDEALCKVLVTSDEYFNGRNVNEPDQTVAKCLNRCKSQNKKFALIDAGVSCFCTDTLPPTDFVPKSQCSYACSGEPGSEGKCGGSWRWSVHAITN